MQFKDSQPAFFSAYIAARLNVDGPGGRTSKNAAAVLISKAAGAGTNLTVG